MHAVRSLAAVRSLEDVQTLADVRTLAACARRATTPCGGGRMVWRVWGDGAPVVLLHGGSGDWTHWARNIPALVRAGRAVYAPDMPGCGESDLPPDGADGDVLPGWIDRGVRALIGVTSFDLVGFSFGAMVAGLYAAARPVGLRRLALVGAPALTDRRGPTLDLKRWVDTPEGAARDAALLHNLRILMLADRRDEPLAFALYAAMARRDRLTGRRLAGTDILARALPQISAPVWALWGARDALAAGRFALFETALAHAPAFAGLTILPNVGHWAPFEAAAAFDRALIAWLEAGVVA